MSRKTLFSTLPLLFILVSWSLINPDIKKSSDEITTSNQIVKLVNDYRLSIGKSALIRNSTADKLAAEHTNYMISKKDINSNNFDIRCETLELRENAVEISENMGYNISAEKTLEAYLANIWLKVNVEGNFTHTGIAVKKDDKDHYYFTQIFYR